MVVGSLRASRLTGAAVFSDDEDALDYLELNSSGDKRVRLCRLTLVYDFALICLEKRIKMGWPKLCPPLRGKREKQPSTYSTTRGNTKYGPSVSVTSIGIRGMYVFTD